MMQEGAINNLDRRIILTNLIIACAIGFSIFVPIALIFEAPMIGVIVGVIVSIGFFYISISQAIKQMAETSHQERKNAQQYQQRFAITIIGYILLLLLSTYLLNSITSPLLRIVLAILPILPTLYGLWAYMTFLRHLDELQQRIQLNAIAFSMGVTGILTFTFGFLEAAGAPQIDIIWVFPMMIIFWGVGQAIAQRQYQ